MNASDSVVVLAEDSASELTLRYEPDGVSVNGVGVDRFGANDNDPVEILPVEVLLWEIDRGSDNAEVEPGVNRLIGGIWCGRLRNDENVFKVIGKLLCCPAKFDSVANAVFDWFFAVNICCEELNAVNAAAWPVWFYTIVVLWSRHSLFLKIWNKVKWF